MEDPISQDCVKWRCHQVQSHSRSDGDHGHGDQHDGRHRTRGYKWGFVRHSQNFGIKPLAPVYTISMVGDLMENGKSTVSNVLQSVSDLPLVDTAPPDAAVVFIRTKDDDGAYSWESSYSRSLTDSELLGLLRGAVSSISQHLGKSWQ